MTSLPTEVLDLVIQPPAKPARSSGPSSSARVVLEVREASARSIWRPSCSFEIGFGTGFPSGSSTGKRPA